MRRFLLALLFVFCATTASAQTRIFLTSGTTWTVPADWNSQGNTIEVLGHGGKGSVQCFGTIVNTGGGGGAYAKLLNFSAVPGSTISIHFGGQSIGGVSDGVWLNNSSTVFAESGWDGSGCGGVIGGGRASASVGSTKFSGGNGSTGAGGGAGTGAGGGAAGLNGAGGNASGSTGGTADAGFGGAGGIDVPPASAGGNGAEWDGTHGSGGGGGSDPAGAAQGGLYGGGGGFGFGGTGGLIVITYTPRNRVSSGVF